MKKVWQSLMVLLTGILAACSPWNAAADTIEGKFVFEKKCPFVGLLYFSDDKPSEEMKTLTIDQVDKTFTRKLVVGTTGAKVVFKNSDQIDHNIYTNDTKSGIFFDAGLVPPGKDSVIEMNWPDEQIIRIGCKIHPHMRSYVANVPSAHHAILEFGERDAEYAFTMKDIPADIRQMKLWIPQYNTLDFSLAAGEKKELPLTMGEKKGGVLVIERR